MKIGVVLALAAAAVPAGLRWLRVAQREHYAAGAVTRFAGRWWRLPGNAALLAVAVGAAVAALEAPVSALLTAGVVAFGPIGLGMRGRTGALAWTPRLRRLAGITAVLVTAADVAALVAGRPLIAAAAALLAPVLVDVALLVAGPLERRLGDVWVDRARRALNVSGARVVAITGSYGKTTTKGYVAHLLSGHMRVVASPASFNNRMGLARAVNEGLAPDAEVFVAEMGTYGVGEIAALCSWVPPDVGVITALGPVHLERMRSLETIAAAKREILEEAAVGVVNVDHPLLAAIAEEEGTRRRIVRCSAVDDRADVHVDPRTGEVRVEGTVIGSADPDRVLAGNLACALGVTMALGVSPTDLVPGFGDLPTPPHRQVVTEAPRGFAIIDDTYNSNPAGADLALRRLAGLAPGGRRVVVTPGMVELGGRQRDENRAFAAAASHAATDVLVVGRTNRAALLSGAAGGPASVIVVASRQEAVAWARRHLGPGDAVLFENDLPDHYP